MKDTPTIDLKGCCLKEWQELREYMDYCFTNGFPKDCFDDELIILRDRDSKEYLDSYLRKKR